MSLPKYDCRCHSQLSLQNGKMSMSPIEPRQHSHTFKDVSILKKDRLDIINEKMHFRTRPISMDFGGNPVLTGLISLNSST